MERTSHRTPDTVSDTGSEIGHQNGHRPAIGHENGHALEIGQDFGHGHIAPPPRPTNDAEAVRAGHALLAIKGVLRGEFEVWVAAHCEFTPRSARRYMDAARASGPFDHEADWLSLPETLPALNEVDPPTKAERAALAEAVEDVLAWWKRGGEGPLGVIGEFAASMASACPTITVGQAQEYLSGLAREAELRAARMEGIAAAFARLPGGVPLWFTRASQEWHRADAVEQEDSRRRLEVYNAGRFSVRHLHDQMRRLNHFAVDLLVQEGWPYPPPPTFPRNRNDVDEYNRKLDEWLSVLPDDVAAALVLPPRRE